MTRLLPSWPVFAPDEIAAVSRVLASGKVNYWTGEETKEFEREYAAHLGARHAIALANGTVALELALRALGIGPGDDVIVPSRTFIATASAVVMVGARPVVADVDLASGNVTADTLRASLTPRTRAFIVVHLAGWPCDMDPIVSLAREHGIQVVEDCAQAHGATYHGRHVGTLGDVACFSFCQDKIVTTGGEGGLLVTDDEGVWERAWSFKDHGKSYATVHRKDHPPGFRWLHESFGTNWRMTEMQSAIGRVQLRKLPEWVAARRRNAERLSKHLEGSSAIAVPRPDGRFAHSYYRLNALVNPSRLPTGIDRDALLLAATAAGAPAFTGSCSEIYREKAFAVFGPQPTLRNARELSDRSIAFLTHPTLTEEDVDAYARTFLHVLEGGGR